MKILLAIVRSACSAAVLISTFGLAILSACGGGDGGSSNTSSSPTQAVEVSLPPLPSGSISYVTPPPTGKLPYPQHNPLFSQAQYDQMVNTNWIPNNFGLYQGTDDGIQYMYLHDGLDFMLPDKTPVYAVKTGTIRDINNGGGIITVDDPVNPNTGWQMAHLDVDPRFKVGDQVRQGQYVGVVRVNNAHTHFNYIRPSSTGSWSYATLEMYPNDLFDLKDNLAPKFDSDLRFYDNASDRAQSKADGVHGKVDIVVAGGDLSSNILVGIGNRSAPAKFALSILNEFGTEVWKYQSDMRNIILPPPFVGDKSIANHAVRLMFKVPNTVELNSWSQKRSLWWILTNLPDHDTPKTITVNDDDMFWDTAAKDSKGSSIFPNGNYTIQITAIDSKGNQAKMVEEIKIKN